MYQVLFVVFPSYLHTSCKAENSTEEFFGLTDYLNNLSQKDKSSSNTQLKFWDYPINLLTTIGELPRQQFPYFLLSFDPCPLTVH